MFLIIIKRVKRFFNFTFLSLNDQRHLFTSYKARCAINGCYMLSERFLSVVVLSNCGWIRLKSFLEKHSYIRPKSTEAHKQQQYISMIKKFNWIAEKKNIPLYQLSLMLIIIVIILFNFVIIKKEKLLSCDVYNSM